MPMHPHKRRAHRSMRARITLFHCGLFLWLAQLLAGYCWAAPPSADPISGGGINPPKCTPPTAPVFVCSADATCKAGQWAPGPPLPAGTMCLRNSPTGTSRGVCDGMRNCIVPTVNVPALHQNGIITCITEAPNSAPDCVSDESSGSPPLAPIFTPTNGPRGFSASLLGSTPGHGLPGQIEANLPPSITGPGGPFNFATVYFFYIQGEMRSTSVQIRGTVSQGAISNLQAKLLYVQPDQFAINPPTQGPDIDFAAAEVINSNEVSPSLINWNALSASSPATVVAMPPGVYGLLIRGLARTPASYEGTIAIGTHP